MATSVAMLSSGEHVTYSIEFTDGDGDKGSIEILPTGVFIPPGQNLANGLMIDKEDAAVLLNAMREVWG